MQERQEHGAAPVEGLEAAVLSTPLYKKDMSIHLENELGILLFAFQVIGF